MKSAGVLLDTHSLLWMLGAPEKLSNGAREILADDAQRICISVGTLWELSIKISVGKLTVPDRFFDRLDETSLERLAISDAHLATYRTLPLYHRDPFDRLLIAQAQVEGLLLVSCDARISEYEVEVFW